jgi:hypothetical protein
MVELIGFLRRHEHLRLIVVYRIGKWIIRLGLPG